MNRIVTALTLTLLAASAANADTHRSQLVKYDDLDLTHEAGLEHLGRRIDWAAKAVCRDFDTPRALDMRRWEECRTRAVQGAWARVRLGQVALVTP